MKSFPAIKDLELLLLIRSFEETLLSLFQAGKLHGTTHTCIGQECVPVALVPLLREDDFVFSNHRGHGHYLARFRDPAGLLAEIMGRDGGVCRGVGGSQHLRRGRFFSTGVQGESVPVAAGAAWQLKREARGGLAVAFIGDGTWGQGAVYEALNMGALWRLPLIIAVENNEIAQTTERSHAMAGTIADRARAFGADFLHCSGNDLLALREQLTAALLRVRGGSGPLVVEFATHRLNAHSKGDDTRPAETLATLMANDWARAWRSAPEFQDMETRVREEMAAVVREVEGRPLARGNIS